MMVRQQALHDHLRFLTFLALGRFLNHYFLSSASEIQFKHVSFGGTFRVLKSDEAKTLAEGSIESTLVATCVYRDPISIIRLPSFRFPYYYTAANCTKFQQGTKTSLLVPHLPLQGAREVSYLQVCGAGRRTRLQRRQEVRDPEVLMKRMGVPRLASARSA
jgi:hypothetical protein